MTLTDTDLRELFADRAATVPADSAAARVAAVDHRVRVIRRRRAAGTSLAVVVTLLVVAGLSGVLRDSRDESGPVPAYQQKVAGGLLPRYAGGGRATAYTSFRTDDKRTTTFTFTPTSWNFLVSLSCDKELLTAELVSVEINGRPNLSGGCGPGVSTGGPSYGEEQSYAESLGIRIGMPSTVRVRVVQERKGTTADKLPVDRGALPDTRVAVAVYTPIAIDDYPFPTQPRKLASLDEGGGSGTGRVIGSVDSRSVGANGQGAVIVELTPAGLHTEIYAVAPGAVTVSVNGRTIDLAQNWTWTSSGFGGLTLTPAKLRKLGIDVNTGDSVSVAFAGHRFAVAGWRAEVREGG